MVENNNYKLINPENFIYFLYRDENKPKKRKLVYVKSHTKEKNIINEINRKLYKNKQIKFNNKNKIFNNLYNFTKNNNFKYTVVVFDFKNFGVCFALDDTDDPMDFTAMCLAFSIYRAQVHGFDKKTDFFHKKQQSSNCKTKTE